MHQHAPDPLSGSWPFGRRPAGITVHIEFRVRAVTDRRRRRRRRGGWWPYHERRRQARRLVQRRCRRDPGLEQAASAVLRRLAVHDPTARRILARLIDQPSPDSRCRTTANPSTPPGTGDAPS